jgi:hypothetical protein
MAPPTQLLGTGASEHTAGPCDRMRGVDDELKRLLEEETEVVGRRDRAALAGRIPTFPTLGGTVDQEEVMWYSALLGMRHLLNPGAASIISTAETNQTKVLRGKLQACLEFLTPYLSEHGKPSCEQFLAYWTEQMKTGVPRSF